MRTRPANLRYASRMSYAAPGVPAHVQRFRARYRDEHIGPRYHGWSHFGVTSLGSLLVIALAISRVRAPSALEWLTVPLSFLLANLGEYAAHRGPMHHPVSGLDLLYTRHTRQHHHFYTDEAMAAESHRDLHMILFPPRMLLFFLGGLAAPVGALLFLLSTRNVAWLFVATAMSYFLSYEWLHLCFHLDPQSLAARLPGMGRLRRHHTRHHDLALMGRWNFNITFPISDALFGTRYKG